MLKKTLSTSTPTTRLAGFTLMELLICVGILSISLLMSIPSMRNFLLNQHLRSEHSRLTMDLLYARSMAVNQGQRVVICPSSNATECLTDPLWESGWMVFIDENNNRQYEAQEIRLRIAPTIKELSVRSQLRQQIRFFPDGSATGSAATITLCGPRGAQFARATVISNSGRIRQIRASTSNNQLNCP